MNLSAHRAASCRDPVLQMNHIRRLIPFQFIQ